MSKENPTGLEMWNRTKIVKAQVKDIYASYPSTRGQNTLLAKRWLARYYPQVKLSAAAFEMLLEIPSFETVFRRGREVRIEFPELQPTEKTVKKRARREEAYRHNYGNGTRLTEYFED